MAEVAAGALVAEQVVSTGVQVGVAYTIAKPVQPLQAVFTCFASTSSLARCGHTITVIGNRAYIFGGETSDGGLASNDVHSVAVAGGDTDHVHYSAVPAIPAAKGGPVPTARTHHSACAYDGKIAVYGGSDGTKPVDDTAVWLYDPSTSTWEALTATGPLPLPPLRSQAKLFCCGDHLILCGGKSSSGSSLVDVWRFDPVARQWARLRDAPVATSNAVLAGRSLYLISAVDALGSNMHSLDLDQAEEPTSWVTDPFPTNPLAGGPRPRENGGLVHIKTGYGRNYLIYFFGDMWSASEQATDPTSPTLWSDVWSFQLRSDGSGTDGKTTSASSLAAALRPAHIKDAIRSTFGADTGTHSWVEVQVKPPEQEPKGHEGKMHPGPISHFACHVLPDQRSIVLWGGLTPSGEKLGDGWIIKLE